MNQFPGISPRVKRAARRFDFFFDGLETCLRKGRGFSLFQADAACLEEFSDGCTRRGLGPRTVRLSALRDGSADLATGLDSARFVILIQDLSYAEFLEMADLIADRLVFSLWFRRIPICFFSALPREAYEPPPMRGEDLHTNFSGVMRALLAEQVLTLLERSNLQLESPEALAVNVDGLLTPIEETMRMALEKHGLAYQPHVRLGHQLVDFLVSVQDKQVVVECDSAAYYEPSQGPEALAGYAVCRFSGSEIEADVEKCIRAVQAAAGYRALPAYEIDSDLDPSQQAAVGTIRGPIRVLAPAGSGKTKTLVNRILHLLNLGIAPERILALAFNKKARDEMQDRLERRGVRGVEVRTFHSFGYEIVREGLGWTFGGPAQRRTAKALMKEAILEHTQLAPARNQDPLEAFLAGMRQAKMELPSLATLTVQYGEKLYPLEPIFHSYLQKQLSANFLDFDDMIYMAVRLLLEDQTLRHQYQSRFEFVLVDEFQDLNEAQLVLLQIIGLPENNIFAVGDDDQMIYGFRGADVKHIVEFEKRFPVASTYVLNTNYRSSRMLVRHAGWLIQHNRDRATKDIQPGPEAQAGRFEVAGGTSLLEQAKAAATWLVEHKKQKDLNWRDYAVLYRYNAYQFPVALMLDAMGIPHSPVSAQPLFQSAVGRDVYSYLQVILFPQEAKASDFERILKRPNRYFTNQLIAQARDWNSFRRLPQLPNLRAWERQKLLDFVPWIEILSHLARLEHGFPSATNCMQTLKTEFGLGEFYREQSRMTDDLDQASDEGLLDVITTLASNYKSPLEFFQFICKSMADASGDAESPGENKTGEGVPEREGNNPNEVFLSTIHRAKGKEFRNVVYFNLSQSAADPKQPTFLEEERRIAYVGATRAKDDLLITFPSAKPSEFLWEMALNPRYREMGDEDLQQALTSTGLHLERARVVLQELEANKREQIQSFREMTKTRPGRLPAWLRGLLHKIQLGRIDRALESIESIDGQIKAHKEAMILPLEREIQAIEEEEAMRAALNLQYNGQILNNY